MQEPKATNICRKDYTQALFYAPLFYVFLRHAGIHLINDLTTSPKTQLYNV
jgi:hypothetical protein